jgi:ABC-type lipoprotein export system ATPase subunit
MSSPTPLLKLENVTKNYVAAEGSAPVPVLRDVTLEIARGESVAVVGPSGSGKSTLLNLIGTLDQPTTGRVWLDGEDLSQLDEMHLAAVRNRKIGFVFQSHHLLPHCTVLENVLVPTLATGRAGLHPGPILSRSYSTQESGPGCNPALPEGAEARARKLLKRVGLGERLHRRPGQISGGERQRVAVVRALINQPALLLADEPTGALDRASATALGQLLVELNHEQDVTLIVVTHALDLARQMGRVLELRDGTLKMT